MLMRMSKIAAVAGGAVFLTVPLRWGGGFLRRGGAHRSGRWGFVGNCVRRRNKRRGMMQKSGPDVTDGKSDSIKPDASAGDKDKPGVLAYITGKSLSELKDKNPLLAHAKEGWIAISEEGTDLVVHSTVTAKSAKAATNLCS